MCVHLSLSLCVRVCERACERACVCVSVRVSVRACVAIACDFTVDCLYATQARANSGVGNRFIPCTLIHIYQYTHKCCSTSFFRAMIAINGDHDANNGLHVISGNGGSTNYRTMAVSGNLLLKKGQYASVFVYSNSDTSYNVHPESTFSCNRFSSNVGFRADKTGNQKMSKANVWQEVQGWRAWGEPGLYSLGGVKLTKTSRFTAPFEGVYFCGVQLRLDLIGTRTYSGYFRINLVLNGGKDTNNGFHAVDGNSASTNYRSMGVAGTIYLKKGNFISPWVYSYSDKSYSIHSESGWGCNLMGTRIGFHADYSASTTLKVGWSKLVKWRTDSKANAELYALGGGLDTTGVYAAPQTGYYICATQIRFDSAASSSYFRVLLALNEKIVVNKGLNAIGGNKGSTSKRSLRIAGTIYLKKKTKVSLYTYSQKDNYYTINSESGWGCHMFSADLSKCPQLPCVQNTGFNADLVKSLGAKKGWKELNKFRTQGESALFNDRQEFDTDTGRFTAKSDGYYLCATQVRLDGASRFGLGVGTGIRDHNLELCFKTSNPCLYTYTHIYTHGLHACILSEQRYRCYI